MFGYLGMSLAALKRDKKTKVLIFLKSELDFIKISQDKAAFSVINSTLIIKLVSSHFILKAIFTSSSSTYV